MHDALSRRLTRGRRRLLASSSGPLLTCLLYQVRERAQWRQTAGRCMEADVPDTSVTQGG